MESVDEKEPMINTTVRFSQDELDVLDDLALKTERSRSWMIRKYVQEGLKGIKP